MSACPACGSTQHALARRHTVASAAHHLVPARRDRSRHEQLRGRLRELFGGEEVEVRRCADCGFWFAHPFVSGTAEIYNLITEGREFYPSHRFEFDLTLDALPRRPLRLLEVGAGDGAFLRRASAAGVLGTAFATEYDEGALASLRRIPHVEAARLTPQELVARADAPFDAVCMFQVLEHLDGVDDVFAALRALTAADGELFIGVPNDASVTMQEELTGFWEMPPNHIGRWTRPALERIAGRHGFRVVDHRYEPSTALAELWEMAKCRYQGRAYRPTSLAGRINDLPVRAVRGPMKRALTGWDLLMLAPTYGKWPPRCQWFRLGEAR